MLKFMFFFYFQNKFTSTAYKKILKTLQNDYKVMEKSYKKLQNVHFKLEHDYECLFLEDKKKLFTPEIKVRSKIYLLAA